MKNAGRAMLVALAPVLLAATKQREEAATIFGNREEQAKGLRGGPPISPASQVHEDIPHEGLTHGSSSGSTSSAKKAVQAAMALSQQTKEEPGEKLEKKEVEKQDEKPVKTEDLKGDREPIQISVSDENLKSFGRENQAEQVQKSESAVVKAATLLKEMTADELVKTVDHARTELHQRTIEARDDAMEKMKQAKKAQEAAKEAFAAAKAAAELAKHTAEAAGENDGQSELEQLKTGVPGEGQASTASSKEKLEDAKKEGEQKASTAASEEKLEDAKKEGLKLAQLQELD